MHQHVEPLQPNVPEKNIDYNDRINRRDIDDDMVVLNGSNRIQCILSYISSVNKKYHAYRNKGIVR